MIKCPLLGSKAIGWTAGLHTTLLPWFQHPHVVPVSLEALKTVHVQLASCRGITIHQHGDSLLTHQPMTITAQVEMFGSTESYYVLRTPVSEPLGNSEISSNWSTDVDFVYKVSLLFKTQFPWCSLVYFWPKIVI